MRRPLARYDGSFRRTALVVALFVTGSISAQTECAQRYDDAKALFDNGDRRACITTLDSALGDCGKDQDLKGRLLFLKALAEAGEDSLDLMRADLERLFRNDRHQIIKPYDPLMKGKPGEADLFGAWEVLQRALRKDLGRWRLGGHASLLRTIPRVTTERTVYAGDDPLDHTAPFGWEVGGDMEWEMIPDLAIRGSAAYGNVGYKANNSTIDYQERIALMPFLVGVKKQVQLKKSPYVPFATLGLGAAWLMAADAEISREEDQDTRYLRSLATDRLSEREQQQYWGEASIGMSRKLGSTVFSMEVAYQRSLTALNSDEGPYTNNDLLAGYYYVDNETFLDAVLLKVSVLYIAAYHRQNRIYP
ncbi:MAG: hypothetical protein JNL43_02565 [Flavobacteriales bacterium]|nr:hypothetical protein [Flavobacteriales bacterium]